MPASSKKSERKVAVETLLERGLSSHREGDVDEAERLYRQVLLRAPSNSNAWYLRSVIAMGAKRYEAAANLLEHAVKHAPANGRFLCNLGEAYRRSGRLDEALAMLGRAAVAEPGLAVVHFNLGLALRDRGRHQEAVASFETAVSLDPGLPGLGRELVLAWSAAGRDELAIAAYEKLRGVLLDEAALRVAVANIYVENGLLDEAADHFTRALELDPDDPDVHGSYAVSLADGGEVERAIVHYRKALELDPERRATRANMLFVLAYHPELDALAIRADAEMFEKRHVPILASRPVFSNTKEPDRRLRVGFVSPDFRRHASAHFVLPLLCHLDRARIEPLCYSNARGPDALTASFRELASVFRDIRSLDDDSAARLVREDGVDVLIDLAMHTDGNRSMLFAKKPAPVQACYVAYLGTTGLSAMDYRFTAPGFESAEERDAWYTERSICLDDVYWCYDPLTSGPEPGDLPAERAGFVTFGSLNAFRKFNATTASLWAGALRAVPGSRMLVHAPAGRSSARALAAFEKEGIAADRLEFVGRMTRAEYLEAYRRIDIGLDTLPFNGGTTSLDALWMGVPVVTHVGRTVVGRAGRAISRALGLEELVATDAEQFAAIAARLASDVPRLGRLRREMRSRLEGSPFMDGPRFSRSFEGACRKMWRNWCGSER